MANRIFCGSGKNRTFDNGGYVIDVSLTMDGLAELDKEFGFTTTGGKRILKLKVSERKEPGKYGESHTVEVETWKPNQNGQQAERFTKDNPGTRENREPTFDDSVPF